MGGSVELETPQEVTAKWVLSPLSLEAWALETSELGLGGGPVDPFASLAREQGEEPLIQRFCLPPPQWSSGLRRWLCPQAGFWGWLRLLGLAQVPRQAPWSQGPPFLFL